MADANSQVLPKKPVKEKINFEDDEVERLITAWGKEPVLFQCSHKDYFKKDAKNSAMERVFEALAKPGVTKEDVQKKMSSLRSYFGKEIGKERSSKLSGSATKDVYTSKWPFFSSLHFLKDNITPRKTSTNLELVSESGTASSPPASSSEAFDLEKEEILTAVDEDSELPNENNYLQPLCVFKTNNPPSAKKRKSNAQMTAVEDEILSTCLKELKKPKMDVDPDTCFGQYIASQLRNIKDGFTKEMLKLEIQQLIVRAVVPPSTRPLTTIQFSDLN